MKKIKTIQQLASVIAKREGKKSQVKIGDIREILSILSDLLCDEQPHLDLILIDNGVRRAKRKK